MKERAVRAMLALIRGVVCGSAVTDGEKSEITADLLPQLYTVSKAHDVAHVVAQGLSDLGLLGVDEISQKFQKQQMLAIYRYQRLNYELQRICAALEAAEIAFIPLKGAVIRAFYPAPWLRTSCDIDVLIHETDLERAIAYLNGHLQYKTEERGSHDVSLFSESGVHVELHYHLIEELRFPTAVKLLARAWDYAEPEEGCVWRHRMREEMFYFYHVAHMAKHFENGGCGVRTLLDQWILWHLVPHDAQKREELVREGMLERFDLGARELAEVWFSGQTGTELTDAMATYVITGGIYGTTEQGVAVKRSKKGGKLGYILSRLFLPYDLLKLHYPILQKHRWLTPIMQIRRWFRLLFGGRFKKSLREMRANESLSQERIDSVTALRQELGL